MKVQRLVKFKVTVSDRPGGIAELCKLISSMGVSIKGHHAGAHLGAGRHLQCYGNHKLTQIHEDIEFDEFCDPNNPRKIKYDDILTASRRIVGSIIRTPCTKAHMSEKLGMDVFLKQEFLQFTGCANYHLFAGEFMRSTCVSFKERGVRNTMLCITEEQKKYGLITASTGNHGMAMSHHATLLGVPCVVVMPVVTAITKVHRCEQLAVDAILIPVGGGSLLCGIAIAVKHLKPDTEIYGIETDKTCSMVESLRKNERIVLDIETTIADALAVNMVGVNTFHNIKGLVDKMRGMAAEGRLVKFKVTVFDRPGGMAEMCALLAGIGVTMRDCVPERAWVKGDVFSVELKVIAETRGWEHTKELIEQVKKHYTEYFFQDMSERQDKTAGTRRGPCLAPNPVCMQKVVCVITGGNIDYFTLPRSLERAKAIEGRIIKLTVTFILETRDLEHSCTLKRVMERIFPGVCEFLEEPFSPIPTCTCYFGNYYNKINILKLYIYIGNSYVLLEPTKDIPNQIFLYHNLQDDFDEFCDPENPRIIKLQDVKKAAERLGPFIVNTPCMLLNTATKKLGIVVASIGNDAAGLCYHASKINCPIIVVMPSTAPLSKLQNRDHPHVLAGYGTMALEILEQVPNVDAVIVPVGSGGLAAALVAVIKANKPKCLVYGVQAESMPVFFNSLENEEPVTIPMKATIADAIALPNVGVNAYANAQPQLDKMRRNGSWWKAQAPAAWLPLSGTLFQSSSLKSTTYVVCILSGGNIDSLLLARCLDRGMAAEGRLVKFS
ncbi:Threonine dehydratase/deaminase, partial [Operophtera brumata]